MKILIYGINFYPELTGIGKYTGEMASWFAKKGHEINVVTAPPYYPEWKIKKGFKNLYKKEYLDKNYNVQRCPLYVPKKQTSVKRIIHLLSFSISSFFSLILKIKWKPDVIIVIAPSLFCAPGALLISKITRAKSVLHVQDFEIDAMFGLGMMQKGYLSKLLLSVEKKILQKFDLVSSISKKMVQTLQDKGVDKQKTYFFPNWVDINFINPNNYSAAFKEDLIGSNNCRIVLYSGNIGNKQGLEILHEVASQFNHDPTIKFVICGSGASKKDLVKLFNKKKVKNVLFHDLFPYQQLPNLINSADVHLVIQKKGTADAFLPSKLSTILSAGGYALVTAEKDTELGILNDDFPGIVEIVEPENAKLIVSSIKNILRKRKLQKINNVARQYAEKFLNKENILKTFNEKLINIDIN